MAKKRKDGLPRKVLTYESKPPLLQKLFRKAIIAEFGSRKRMERTMKLIRLWLRGETSEIRKQARKELLDMRETKKRKTRLK